MTSAEERRVWAKLKRWKLDPASMVREEFGVEPDAWQLEALAHFPHCNRLAMKACKGPGKTAVLAWLILNFLATRPHARVGVTSITGDNLATNLWPELSKWMNKSAFFRETFVWTATRISHRFHPNDWFAVARSWPKSGNPEAQSDALAGLHADYAMFVLDESGGIPQAVMATAEAVLASGIETKVIQAGNPTHTTGPLYRAVTTDRHLWQVVTITGDPDNPKRSPRISLEWAQQQIASYGRDNPWVMVNVLGEFPPSSINALLGANDVEAAMQRHLPIDVYGWAQKRLGVDVARFGDDRSVIFPRQGLASFKPRVLSTTRATGGTA
jgi:phage terminase large subunit